MIDFRYHLVSLVSVFLALAIGIVLGAGPLKESIDSTLTSQVQALRQEKDDLHAEILTANTSEAQRDSFLTALTPSMVSGALPGRSVAIVTLPGADENTVDPLVTAITEAGGTVTGRISVNNDWVDPAQTANRLKVIADLAAELPAGTVTSSTDPDEQLSGLLADATVSTGAGTFEHTSTVGTQILKALRSAGLIDVKGDVTGLAGAALVVAPANPQAIGKPVATPSPGVVATTDADWISLATAFDTIGGGTVVIGPASSASSGGTLEALRKDSIANAGISTVDNGSTPMGVIDAVLALRDQLAGGSGEYGFVGGNTKLTPPLVGSPVGATPTPTVTKK